ncbi:MT-A70 family methyltransferase [Frankia sp. BMG5.23]|uniref:MT-A70 family methyltransferase n=1 Tax=Frankia sp. BMG5.23 TaxID=683305 RepID=UPI000460B3B3|nr:MT-A70 family methyltransferase [Frankia sp. BMG5.23]KDA44516.1 transcriptional activator, adenine-specific DNA methyltransferase [Frankia sp. BMG5.23]
MVNAETSPTEGGRYATILADPPWDVEQKGGRGAVRHYPLMPLGAIQALHVPQLVQDDAHCWLWVTNATVHAGRDVLAAWGFTYRSILTWIKPKLGLGNYLRNQTEHLLLGTRGRAPIRFRAQGSWFYAPVQEHSHKPEEQYAIIERCSPGPYLELFARRKRAGWQVWGNEVDSDVTL